MNTSFNLDDLVSNSSTISDQAASHPLTQSLNGTKIALGTRINNNADLIDDLEAQAAENIITDSNQGHQIEVNANSIAVNLSDIQKHQESLTKHAESLNNNRAGIASNKKVLDALPVRLNGIDSTLQSITDNLNSNSAVDMNQTQRLDSIDEMLGKLTSVLIHHQRTLNDIVA